MVSLPPAVIDEPSAPVFSVMGAAFQRLEEPP